MSAAGLASRFALSGLLLGLLASACVRLSTPDSFSCSIDSDCLGSDRCSQAGVCKPHGTCDYTTDCAEDQTCREGKCARAECYAGHETACSAYRCNTYEHTCYVDCAFSNSNCIEGNRCSGTGVCEPAPNLANGKACSEKSDCASNICCGPSAARVCAASCKTNGEACDTNTDCESGACCASQGLGSRCQSTACAELPLGAACSKAAECVSGACALGVCAKKPCSIDDDCGDVGFCVQGSCQTDEREIGETCKTAAWCKSGNCSASICRGDVATGETCTTDASCAPGRVCCASPYNASHKCSAVSSGCDGANGDSCILGGSSACLSGMCLATTMCTQTCKIDADCGTSPWGSKNFCKRNGVGNYICFPGCKTSKECTDNVDDGLTCMSGVCAGDGFTADELELW